MKEIFETPVCEIVNFVREDVVCASTTIDSQQGQGGKTTPDVPLP